MPGITLDGTIEKITDGDTIRVTAEGRLFKVRVLGLDTEESVGTNNPKPITAWGKAASEYAKGILPVGAPVRMAFAGDEPVIVGDAINVRYLDNFERPLASILLPDPIEGFSDYTELMIRRGYSPYFVKYGRAELPDQDARYAAAEVAAQEDDIGVWNQFLVNGVMRPEDAPRNYARLMVWWELRARIIDVFRAAQAAAPGSVLDTRLDYARLLEIAAAGGTATVFIELTEGMAAGGVHYVIRSSSRAQPVQLFLPHEERPEIVAVKRLLMNRYVSSGEDFPRRNYAYVTGTVKTFAGRPEMVVESTSQISDLPPAMAG